MGPSQPHLADGTPYVLAHPPIWDGNMQSKNRTQHLSTSAFLITSNPQALSILERGRQVHLEKIQKDAESLKGWFLFSLPLSRFELSNAISFKSSVHL